PGRRGSDCRQKSVTGRPIPGWKCVLGNGLQVLPASAWRTGGDAQMNRILMFAGATSLAMASLSGGLGAQEAATIAFLMPDQASTRYEEHDFPGFKAAMAELCPDCTVIYQ